MADPVVLPTQTVNYVFGFSNSLGLSSDLVLGGMPGAEVIRFYFDRDTVTPLNRHGLDYMVSQPGPINDTLYNHPKLLFALCMQQTPNTLKSVFPADRMAQLTMYMPPYGNLIIHGVSA
jgi:hypothetical protein